MPIHTIELVDIAALVSGNRFHNHQFHTVYNAIDKNLMEFIETARGPPTFKNTFSPPLNNNHLFWKLYTSSGCDTITFQLASTISELIKRNFTITYRNEPITNIFIVNTVAFDVSDLIATQPTILTWEDGTKIALPLFSTYANIKAFKSAHLRKASEFLGRGVVDPTKQCPDSQLDAIVSLCGLKDNEIAPYYWFCAQTKDNKLVHIDLSAPAYNVHDYFETTDLNTMKVSEGPVLVFETDNYQLDPNEVVGFEHKFWISDTVWPYTKVLYPDLRHFNAVRRGVKLQVTPLPTYLDLNAGRYEDSITEKIAGYYMGKELAAGMGIKFLNGANSGLVGKVSDLLNLKATVQGKKKDQKIHLGELSFFPAVSVTQFLTLEEMKNHVNDAHKYSFSPRCAAQITGLKSEKGKILNGAICRVIQIDQKSNIYDSRWQVEFVDNRFGNKFMSIAGKNLTKVKANGEPIEKAVDTAARFFKDDPVGSALWAKWSKGHTGFTTTADPKFKGAIIYLLEIGFFPDPKKYKVCLQIAEHPKGEAFRQFVLKINHGITEEEYLAEMENQDFEKFTERLTKVGVLSARSSPKLRS
jgi:hypothetical protein